ncbi:hypothetical protein C8P66_13138 [Humitalea rosea]|uniref:Uncharacterized protein n=1 Tax=Humitalea rosea TaxID=990373 RepID=A0A2W7I166_9PROT|nr:hypothetical protein [Humitalea rosea]PZW39005.1 hypothetical protein C8P66_13138 [Humitalea rosea]
MVADVAANGREARRPIDPAAPAFEVALRRARPWRAAARQGGIQARPS